MDLTHVPCHPEIHFEEDGGRRSESSSTVTRTTAPLPGSTVGLYMPNWLRVAARGANAACRACSRHESGRGCFASLIDIRGRRRYSQARIELVEDYR